MIREIAIICFAGGLLAFGLGTLALFKFPDAYSRMHGIGIGETIGSGLIGIGLFLLSPSWILRGKLIFILALYWIVNPTSSHLTGKAAIMCKTDPYKNTVCRIEPYTVIKMREE